MLIMIERKCSYLGRVTCQDQSFCCLGNHQWPSPAQEKYGRHLHSTDRAVVAAVWLDQITPVTESYSYKKKKGGKHLLGFNTRPYILLAYLNDLLCTDYRQSNSSQVTKQKADCIRELGYIFFSLLDPILKALLGAERKGKSFLSGYLS